MWFNGLINYLGKSFLFVKFIKVNLLKLCLIDTLISIQVVIEIKISNYQVIIIINFYDEKHKSTFFLPNKSQIQKKYFTMVL